MMKILRNKYRGAKRKYKLFLSVNWIKTIYFNFKKFPFSVARKLPVFFLGKVKFSNLSGEIVLEGSIKTAMIAFGQQFEFPTTSKGTAELYLAGKWIFKGRAQIGKDFAVLIGEGAYCEFGDMALLGSNVKMVCKEKIVIGNWTGIGYQSQIIDTNSHPMKDTQSGGQFPMIAPIYIGSFNAVSNRVTIMLKTKTPDNIVIASNSLCNTDYTPFGQNVLIGGIPARLLKENYARDWEGEMETLTNNRLMNW